MTVENLVQRHRFIMAPNPHPAFWQGKGNSRAQTHTELQSSAQLVYKGTDGSAIKQAALLE